MLDYTFSEPKYLLNSSFLIDPITLLNGNNYFKVVNVFLSITSTCQDTARAPYKKYPLVPIVYFLDRGSFLFAGI